MYIKVRLNSALRGNPKGSIIKIKVSDGNIPEDIYWRARFKDAKIDNCIEIIHPEIVKSVIKKKYVKKEERKAEKPFKNN